MAELGQEDAETGPANPIRRRTGSFPVRAGSGDSQRGPPAGARHVRWRGVDDRRSEGTYFEEPEEYAPPAMGRPGRRSSGRPPYLSSDYDTRADDPVALRHVAAPAQHRFVRGRRSRSRSSSSSGSRSRSVSLSRKQSSYTDRSSTFATQAARSWSAGSDDSVRDRVSDARSFHRAYTAGDGEGDVSGDEDDPITTQAYEFRLSRLSRGPSPSPSVISSDAGLKGPSLAAAEVSRSALDLNEDQDSQGRKRALQVYMSEYTGDAYSDGNHSAKLTVVSGPGKPRQPIFRWIHLKQDSLDFDELSREISHLSGISDSDRHNLARLMSEVLKNCIKSTPTARGSNVKHMEPSFVQVSLVPGQSPKGQPPVPRTATWLSIPYLSLEKYTALQPAADTATFPTQTLLQAQYSGVPPRRDVQQQAVQQLGHVPPGLCFHIDQLWCVVLDNSLLVTCGTTSAESALHSDMLEIPTAETEQTLKQPGVGGEAMIYVSYTSAVLWALPCNECVSWFAFVSHFRDFWPRTLNFSHGDRPITADDWPRMLSLARHPNTKLTLHLTIGRAPQPPARGILKTLVGGEAKAGNQTADEPRQNLSPPPTSGGGARGQTTDAGQDGLPDRVNDRFHVFTWLETVLAAGDSKPQIQIGPLKAQLQEVEDYLENGTSFSDRREYQDCHEATRVSCFTYLREQGASTEQFKKRPKLRQEYEDRIDVLNAADIVFRFFLPVSFMGPTVGRFWGAIHRLIQMPETGGDGRRARRGRRRTSHSTDHVVPAVRSYLRMLTQAILSFQRVFSHAQPSERTSVAVPDDLVRAWLHLLMALIHGAQGTSAWVRHTEITTLLIKGGMAEVIEGMASEPLLDKAVILPMEIVSLISLKLLQDSTGGHPATGATYSKYLDALAYETATRPSERSIQHRIRLLKQEIDVILETVSRQRVIFTSIVQSLHKTRPPGSQGAEPRMLGRQTEYGSYCKADKINHSIRPLSFYVPPPRVRSSVKAARYLDKEEYGEVAYRAGVEVEGWTTSTAEFYKLSPVDPGGFRELLTTECLSILDKRTREFEGFDRFASDLRDENMNKFEDTKDRQELALYAFTIVTVVFLPLSFVASVFGMNTSDIRDMSSGQWAYWASAIPVTLLVIVAGLWWMGALGPIVSWVLRRGDGRGSAGAPNTASARLLRGPAAARDASPPSYGYPGDGAYDADMDGPEVRGAEAAALPLLIGSLVPAKRGLPGKVTMPGPTVAAESTPSDMLQDVRTAVEATWRARPYLSFTGVSKTSPTIYSKY